MGILCLMHHSHRCALKCDTLYKHQKKSYTSCHPQIVITYFASDTKNASFYAKQQKGEKKVAPKNQGTTEITRSNIMAYLDPASNLGSKP